MTDSRWKNLALEVIGCFVSALGLYSFAVAAGVPVTGVAGIGAILFRLFGLPIGVTNIIMNIPIVLICFKYLGKDFFFRSVRCMVLFAIFTDYVLAALPVYQGDRMLATICGGVISGGLAVFGTMGFSRVGAGVIFALAFLALLAGAGHLTAEVCGHWSRLREPAQRRYEDEATMRGGLRGLRRIQGRKRRGKPPPPRAVFGL